ncbi:trypsin-like peptidase domain-containing protein [Corynebacterium auriscanis]|uniref:S1C family serine protease n=1 Tax=Corynebacterium auriscanis TaxID=99807 RepID=UPI003CF2F467
MTTNNPGGNDYGKGSWDQGQFDGQPSPQQPSAQASQQSGSSQYGSAPYGAKAPQRTGTSQHDTSQYGSTQNDTSQYGSTQNDTTQYGVSQHDAQSQYGASQHDAQSQYGASQHDAQPVNMPGPGQVSPHPQSSYPTASYPSSSQFPPPQQPKRWSTATLVAMVLAGSLVAGAATAVVGNELNGTGYNSSSSTSFDENKPTSDTKNTSGRPPAQGSVEEVAAKVLPSVVSIQVKTASSGADGSGSIISNDGLIVTNNHVVAGAEDGVAQIVVQLNDGRVLKAKLVAADPTTDVAVIKAVGATDLTPIKFGDSNKLNVGQDVVAIGSPLGLSSTVTTGIVSAKNRPVQAGGEKGGEASLIDAIQTDAAINPGNSGGALVNMAGELVGIPSVIATLGGGEGQQSGSIGLGFAIPINQAQDIAKQLIDKKKVEHPAIGAQVNTSPNSPNQGAQIVRVNEGSPAAKAGLKDGDIVIKVDDRLVEGGVGLIAAIRSHRVGDTVTLTVLPKGSGDEEKIEVTLGSR